MFEDSVNIASEAPLHADICIIGGGAAGITIAREFIGAGQQVVLLESGGQEIEPETQDLYKGANIGRPYYDLDVCRLRYFGGTTNHWAGWCRAFSPIDFAKRSWIPHSGWPIDYDSMAPFYQRASKVLQLPSSQFDQSALSHDFPEVQAFPFDERLVHGECFQFSPPTRFGETYGPELMKAQNISVLFHANVVAINAEPGSNAIRSVRYVTLGGKHREVLARTFILATGGIENARMLLVNNIGNDHDVVGRFFMEHPEPTGGMVMVIDQQDLRWVPFVHRHPERRSDQRNPLGCIALSPEVQERERIINTSIGLNFVPLVHSDGLTAFQRLLQRGQAKPTTKDDDTGFTDNLWRVVSDLDGLSSDAATRVREGRMVTQLLEIDVYGQQAPNPDSRVTLGDERDALGMPRPKMDWRLTDFDRHSVNRMLHIVAQELGRLGLGRMKIAFEKWEPDFYYGNHHMGTTRMSDNPKTGVVDADCRVHGMSNLYVAGSSVFPTSGTAPPTLTIVALALRLADHLKARTV